MSQTILVVDDEPNIVEVLALYLQREGFGVLAAQDGRQALDLAREQQPDLIVLDIMLPFVSGLDVTSQLRRESSVPIIMLTARTQEIDRINGLDLGADDYVVKPFSPREVVARVRAVLRRLSAADEAIPRQIIVETGDLIIDPNERRVTLAGQDVSLTAREFDLLSFLASSPRQVFTRSQLLDHVWGREFIADEGTVTVHVRRLREKIESNPSQPRFVQTVWGVGYRFNDAADG